MTLLLALALTSSLVLASTQAEAASVKVAPFGIGDDGETVYALTLRGDIHKGDDRKVAAALGTALVERCFPGFIELRSPGGNADASLGIAAILQRYGLPVLVRGSCTSGCAVIALSAWRGRLFVVEGGSVGLHQAWSCSRPDPADNDCVKGRAIPVLSTTWKIAAALKRYGVPARIIEKMVRTDPDRMTFLTDEDLKLAGARVKR